MAKSLRLFSNSAYLLVFLAITIGCANSARLLDELDPLAGPANPLPTPVPTGVLPQPNPLPSGQFPAALPLPVPTTPDVDDVADESPAAAAGATSPGPAASSATAGPTDAGPPDAEPEPAGGTTSATSGPINGAGGATASASGPANGGGGATSASGPAGPAGGGATSAEGHGKPTLSFFMHDIVGGSQPTVRMVTGLVASAVSNVAFTKANNNIFPVSGGTPLTTANVNGFLNSNRNNLPLIAGLNGQTGVVNTQTTTVIQNTGNNNIVAGGASLPFVAAGQLSTGAATLQKLMFGSITVIDDVLTEQHELGSGPVLGRAQGFYLASSLDGNSHTMVMTVIVHGGDHHVEDTISLFGVHRTATLVSHVAVIGGTGKFENAQGFATVESLPVVDQHTTDGVDTIMHVNIYLSE